MVNPNEKAWFQHEKKTVSTESITKFSGNNKEIWQIPISKATETFHCGWAS